MPIIDTVKPCTGRLLASAVKGECVQMPHNVKRKSHADCTSLIHNLPCPLPEDNGHAGVWQWRHLQGRTSWQCYRRLPRSMGWSGTPTTRPWRCCQLTPACRMPAQAISSSFWTSLAQACSSSLGVSENPWDCLEVPGMLDVLLCPAYILGRGSMLGRQSHFVKTILQRNSSMHKQGAVCD